MSRLFHQENNRVTILITTTNRTALATVASLIFLIAAVIAGAIGNMPNPSAWAESNSDLSMLSSSPTADSDFTNQTNGLNSIFGDPFFVDMGSQDTATRVISTDPMQTEDSFIANVTIRGVGNATESATFITTHDPDNKTTTSVGQGIITTSDGNETATYTAKDLGVTNEEGEVIFRGIEIFHTNSTGRMSFMDNLVGLYVYENNPDGTRKSGKIWEWK